MIKRVTKALDKKGRANPAVMLLRTIPGAARYGHITREGLSVVRRLLVEAASQGVRRSGRTREYCERIRRDDPGRKKIAIVATAHYLAREMAAMLRTGEVFREEA
jgi:hypothetical protein